MKLGTVGRQFGVLVLAVGLAACGGGGFGVPSGSSSSGGGSSGGGSSGGGTTATGVPGTLTIASAQPSIIADGHSTATITATLVDTAGVPINRATIDFSTNAGTVSPASTTTNANGIATVSLKSSNTVGRATVTANETASGLSNNVNVSFIAGPATQVVLSAAPGNLIPGGVASVSVSVTDANGNPVSGEPVNLKVSPNNSGGQFDNISVTTDVNGRATAHYTAGSGTGNDTLIAKLSGGQTGTSSVNVSNSALTVGALTLKLGSPSVVADGVSTDALTATVTDTSGNPIPRAVVNFSATAGTLAASSDTTNSGGVAQVMLTAPSQVGNATATASTAGYSATQSLSFIAGTPTNVLLSASPASLAPGGTASINVQVTDAHNNPVSGQQVNFGFVSGGNASVGQFASASAITDTNGRASTTYRAGSTLGTDKLQASLAGGAHGTANITVTSTALTVGSLTFTVGSSSIVADGTTADALTATVTDSSGKPIPNASVSFNTTAGALAASSVTTDSTGVAQTLLTSPTQVGNATVTASTGGFSKTQSISFTAGTATTATVTASPTSMGPGGSTSVQVVVTDVNHNPVPGQQVNFSATTNNSGGQFSSSSATTDANGRATTTYTAGRSASTAVTDTLQAALANGVNGTVALSVDPTATTIGGLTLSVANATTTAGATQTVTATVTSSSGQPLQGKQVGFSATAGSFGSSTATTDANGLATVTYTAPATAGSVTLTASSGGYSSSATVTVSAGTATAVNLTAAPATVAPKRVSSITAVVTDAGGNGVPNHAVQFTTTAGTLANANATTNANGVATVSFTAPASGTATITAKATPENIAGTTTVTASSTAVSPGGLTLTALSSSIPADGASQTTFQATVTDSSGSPLVGQAVNFTASAGTPPTSSVTTDNSGHASFVLTSATVPGTATVTASIAGFTSSATVTFTAATPASVALTLNPPAVSSGGVTTVNATVLDASGNPVPGITVNFSVPTNNSNGTLATTSAVSDANGRVSTTYTAGNAVGSVTDTIQAKIATTGVTPGTATLTVTNPVKTVSLISSSPQLPSNASTLAQGITLTALVKDQNSNVVANVPVQFAATLDSSSSCGNGGALQVVSGTTDATGTATATLYTGGDPTNQTIDVTATAGGVHATLSVKEIGTKLAISGPSAVGLNSTTNYTVTLTDVGGTPIVGQTLSVVSGPLGNSITSPNLMTDANGQVVVGYVANNGGGDTLTANTSPCTTYASSATKTIQVATQNLTIVAPNANSQIPFAAAGTFSIGAAVASGGGAYAVGDVLTVQGGTAVTPAQLTVSQVASGRITAVTVTNAGEYTALPTSPATVTGGSGSGATFTVSQNITVKLTGGMVNGKTIMFNATRGTLSSSTAPTNAAGVATVSITQSSAAGNSGGAVVTATCTDCSPQISASVPVQFNATTPATVKLQASPSTVAINGTSTITATLRDANDNLVANQLVQFTLTDDSGGGLLQSSGTTDSSGKVTVTYQAGSTAGSLNGAKITATNSSIGAGSPTYYIESGVGDGTGSGYAVGEILTVVGGTPTPAGAAAQLKVVSVAGAGGITAVTVTAGGTYTSSPTNPASVTGGTGTGAIFNLVSAVASPNTSVTSVSPVPATGSGYAVGDILTVTGGTFTTAAQLKVVSVTGAGGITAVTVTDGGTYTSSPANPASVTGGTGTGAIFNLTPEKNGTVALTVGGQALRIVLGTGNTITALNSTQYQLPYSVLVTDSAGNPPPAGSVVDLVMNAISYQKGVETFGTVWAPNYAVNCSTDPDCTPTTYPIFGCLNEDANLNGVLDPGEDYNGNGILDPGNVVSVPSSVTLDSNGSGQFSITYQKDRAYWVEIFLTATINVNGNQGTTTASFVLPGLASDFNQQTDAPPGQTSPYGTASSCANPN